MQTFFTIASGVLGFISAVLLLFDWFDLINKIQIKRNMSGFKSALAMIDKHERQIHTRLNSKGANINKYYMGGVFGVIAGQRVAASVYDNLHQTLRRTYGLPDFSLLDIDGILNRGKIVHSFEQIHNELVSIRENNEQIDLRWPTFWLVFATFLTGIIAALL